MLKILFSPLAVAFLLLVVLVLVLRRAPRERSQRLALWLSAGVLAVLAIGGLPLVSNGLRTSLERQVPAVDSAHPPRLDAVFVSGGDVRRLPCGIVALKTYHARWLILPHDQNWAALAPQLGVDPRVVIQEPSSANTHWEAVNLQKVTQVQRTDVIGVATDAWHLPRALREMRRYFPNAIGIPCSRYGFNKLRLRDFLPNSDALAETTRMLDEYLGRAWYAVRYH